MCRNSEPGLQAIKSALIIKSRNNKSSTEKGNESKFFDFSNSQPEEILKWTHDGKKWKFFDPGRGWMAYCSWNRCKEGSRSDISTWVWLHQLQILENPKNHTIPKQRNDRGGRPLQVRARKQRPCQIKTLRWLLYTQMKDLELPYRTTGAEKT